MEVSSQPIFSAQPLTNNRARRVNITPSPSDTDQSSQPENDEESSTLRTQQTTPGLTQGEQRAVQRLRTRDREVRAHEAAHAAAGGQFVTGGPSFTFQRGPDGRSYAIGGEVGIDTSSVANDPEASLAKANTVRRAALAPAQPSPQDLRVAANASSTAAQARVEIAALRAEEAEQAQQERIEAVEATPDLDNSADDADAVASVNAANDAENSSESEGSVGDNNNEASTPAVNSNDAVAQQFQPEVERPATVSLFA